MLQMWVTWKYYLLLYKTFHFNDIIQITFFIVLNINLNFGLYQIFLILHSYYYRLLVIIVPYLKCLCVLSFIQFCAVFLFLYKIFQNKTTLRPMRSTAFFKITLPMKINMKERAEIEIENNILAHINTF